MRKFRDDSGQSLKYSLSKVNSFACRFLVRVSSAYGVIRKESNSLMCSHTDLSTAILFGRIMFMKPISTAMDWFCVEVLVGRRIRDTDLRSRRLGDKSDSVAWPSMKEHLSSSPSISCWISLQNWQYQPHLHCIHAGLDLDQVVTKCWAKRRVKSSAELGNGWRKRNYSVIIYILQPFDQFLRVFYFKFLLLVLWHFINNFRFCSHLYF